MRFNFGKHIGMEVQWVEENDKDYIKYLNINYPEWRERIFEKRRFNGKSRLGIKAARIKKSWY